MKKIFIVVGFLFIFNSLAHTPGALYLDLMKKCLLNLIYRDEIESKFKLENRNLGRDWPQFAHTMIGLARLNNLQFCCEDVLKNNVPGDFIETGVWRGGATIFMRAILQAYAVNDRTVWVADSFCGLPVATLPVEQELAWLHNVPELKISLEEVKKNFSRYDLLDDQVKFLKGWFNETLPTAPIQQLAILRLDGDYYTSTMDALNNLYNKLSVGGYVIVDDYMIVACARAVDEFRMKKGITAPLQSIDGWAVFWKKETL